MLATVVGVAASCALMAYETGRALYGIITFPAVLILIGVQSHEYHEHSLA